MGEILTIDLSKPGAISTGPTIRPLRASRALASLVAEEVYDATRADSDRSFGCLPARERQRWSDAVLHALRRHVEPETR